MHASKDKYIFALKFLRASGMAYYSSFSMNKVQLYMTHVSMIESAKRQERNASLAKHTHSSMLQVQHPTTHNWQTGHPSPGSKATDSSQDQIPRGARALWFSLCLEPGHY